MPPTDSVSVPTHAAHSFIGGNGTRRDDPSGYHDDYHLALLTVHLPAAMDLMILLVAFPVFPAVDLAAPSPAMIKRPYLHPNNTIFDVPDASVANHTGDHETPGAHSVLSSLPAHRNRTPVSPSVDGACGSVASRRSARRGAGAGDPFSTTCSTQSSSQRINQTDN